MSEETCCCFFLWFFNVCISDITYGEMVTSQPFSNTVDFGQLQGKHIKEVLEQSAGAFDNARVLSDLKLLQVSGSLNSHFS